MSNLVVRRSWVAIGLLPLLAGCASAPLKPADLAARDAADALVRQGCYDCLLEAKSAYERLAVGKARPLLSTRVFEVELLLVLREKELAIDSSAARRRAAALASELPETAEAGRYLAVVDAVPADDVGVSRAEDAEFRRTQSGYISRIDGELAWLAAGTMQAHVRQYLALALDCSYLSRRRVPAQPASETAPRDAAPDAPPLIAYRTGICGSVSRAVLERVRQDVPRFVETAYFLVCYAVATAQQTGGGKARELLSDVSARFPGSPSVVYLSGNFEQLIGDCRAALKYYDATIALTPGHENAWLGRVVCQSFLKRTDEAIAAASHMIEESMFNLHEAYYWRAWNRHLRGDLEAARADIERAKAIASNGRIHTLAGVIEHDQDDLNPAERDLVAAMNASEGDKNCTARWYLGLVEMKRNRWLESAAQFEGAMKCYEGAVSESEAGLRAIQANPNLEPDFQARQVAGFEAAIKEDSAQQYAAAFNAANHFARAGDLAKARALVDIAAKDPALAARVAELRRIIGGGAAQDGRFSVTMLGIHGHVRALRNHAR